MKTIKIFFTFIFSLLSFVLFSQTSCLPEGITFSTQEQIDSFQDYFPECMEIEGDVLIEGNDISNLDSLIVITAVWGNL